MKGSVCESPGLECRRLWMDVTVLFCRELLVPRNRGGGEGTTKHSTMQMERK